jgi:hypothetical protein
MLSQSVINSSVVARLQSRDVSNTQTRKKDFMVLLSSPSSSHIPRRRMDWGLRNRGRTVDTPG